ncbi:preprotein translocase [Streptococcus sanguinis]|uniref:preprotein translocase n=1 Tax=Streptococcus sanguinis TaxID=1305 RepID=UPI000B02E209|nr:preprotein translocase [Streptococcus sanguinis]PLA64626.1 preprotein translocase [Streptococcus salivarius]
MPDFQKNSIVFEKTDKKQIAGRKGIDGFVRIELFKKTITVRKQQTSCLLNKGEIK